MRVCLVEILYLGSLGILRRHFLFLVVHCGTISGLWELRGYFSLLRYSQGSLGTQQLSGDKLIAKKP